MSKSDKKKTPVVPRLRVRRPRDAAKKAANEAAAARRLAALQCRQEARNALRAELNRRIGDGEADAILAERRAAADVALLRECDMKVGGEVVGRRIVRWLGRRRVADLDAGTLPAVAIVAALWRYAATQHEMLRPPKDGR